MTPQARVSRRKLVYQWRAQEAKITAQCGNTRTAHLQKNRPLGAATVLPAEAEKEIVVWINQLRDEGNTGKAAL